MLLLPELLLLLLLLLLLKWGPHAAGGSVGLAGDQRGASPHGETERGQRNHQRACSHK